MIDIKKNPEAVGKLKVGTSAATPADNSILASDLVQAERLIAKKSTGSGNTEIKIENDSASNAAVLTLEGKRTSDNDCAQILIANSGENVAAIKGFRSGANDSGKLELQTSASGSSGLASRLSISSTGATTLTASSQNVLHVNRTTSDGDCLLVEAGGSAKMRIGTLGITFPNGGYAPASAAANQLDYYEEGTWIPVYAPSAGSFATMTMDVLSAKYTRVGNTVFVQATIRTDDVDITGGSGSLRINGLPFPVAGSGAYGTLYIGEAGSFASGKFPCAGYCTVGQSYITLTKLSGVAGSILGAQVDSLTTGTTANMNSLIFAARYTV